MQLLASNHGLHAAIVVEAKWRGGGGVGGSYRGCYRPSSFEAPSKPTY